MTGWPLQIQAVQTGGQVTLIVHGEIDLATVPRLTECLNDALLAGDGDVRVDLGDVDFIDAAGMGALAGAAIRLNAAGRSLLVVNVRPRLRRVLEAGRLGELVRVPEAG